MPLDCRPERQGSYPERQAPAKGGDMRSGDQKRDDVLNSEQQKQVLDAALSVLSRGGMTATIVEKVAERMRERLERLG